MVESQIVILVVAGSNPVGHPGAVWHARCLEKSMPSLDLFGDSEFRALPPAFWQRIAYDDSLVGCGSLEKLVTGCEIIAALDDLELLAA